MLNYLSYIPLGGIGASNSTHTISDKGYKYLQENLQSLESLLSNGLGYIETLDGVMKITSLHAAGKKVVVFDENIFVLEGRRKTITSQVYERSKFLRDRAIDFYTKDDTIVCQACGFDFHKTYGEIGRGYIEIHHQKPVFQYEETDFPREISDALKDLIPLCSNCYRIIHRKKDRPLSLEELREMLTNRGN